MEGVQSQYVYNKHNTTWKVLCTVFTHSFTFKFTFLIVAVFRRISVEYTLNEFPRFLLFNLL